MITIGLTGGIGSGKSTIADIFKAIGIPVFESDAEGRKILEDADVILSIKNTFGVKVTCNGSIDRKTLAAIVFNNEEKLQELNAIIHPAVQDKFSVWQHVHTNAPYVINEAAILFESGLNKQMSFTINVIAPLEVRINRVVSRDGITKDLVMDRIKNQLSDQERSKLSNWTIENDGIKAILPQVLKIDNIIRSKIL